MQPGLRERTVRVPLGVPVRGVRVGPPETVTSKYVAMSMRSPHPVNAANRPLGPPYSPEYDELGGIHELRYPEDAPLASASGWGWAAPHAAADLRARGAGSCSPRSSASSTGAALLPGETRRRISAHCNESMPGPATSSPASPAFCLSRGLGVPLESPHRVRVRRPELSTQPSTSRLWHLPRDAAHALPWSDR